MTRLAGFLLLQLAAAMFAGKRVADKRSRTEALYSYCDMLGQLRGLLESDGSPMPALLQTLSKRCTGEASAFVGALNIAMTGLGQMSFQEIWRRVLAENDGLLDEEAGKTLEALGGVLGRYDLATELDALDQCRGQLRQRLENMQNAQTQDTRVTWGVALSASLLLGILLI